MDVVHLDVGTVLLCISHIAHYFTGLQVGKHLACSIVVETFRVTVPTPVSPREHTRYIKPSKRLGNEIKLYTHVVGIGSGHVQRPAVFYLYTFLILIVVCT